MIETVNSIMQNFIDSLNEPRVCELYKKLPHGKKLRTKLILTIAGENKNACTVAAIIELIHLASLLHDDVIDDAATRRGKSSINAVFGDKTAIMLGDILYSKAFYELTSMPNDIAKIVSNAVSQLSMGELLDVSLSEQFNKNEALYFDMIYKKTASLIEASAKSAAILANKDIEKYETYGKNLGLAFQVVDDILDITSNSQVLGKPALNDFKEGKTTLPYIYLYKALEKKETLLAMFKKDLSQDEIIWIRENMQKLGILEKSIHEAKEFGRKAQKAIKNENLPKLDEVVVSMIKRDF